MNKARLLSGALLLAAWIRLPGTLSAQQPEALPLKQAVELALQNSQQVAEAQARYDVAANAARMNASTFHPNVYAGSGAAYTYGFPQTPGGTAPSIVALSYLQTLFNTSLRGQVRAAGERTQVQSLELEKARNAVTMQTTEAYLELGKVRHSLDLARSELDGSARILDFTRQRVSEGRELPIEVTRSELADARLKQRVVQLEGQERVLQRELTALLGLPSDQRIEVDPTPLSLTDQQRERDLIDSALVTNLDLRQAEHERLAREHVVAGEEGMRWPTVDIFGWYGLFARYNNFQAYYQRFQQHNFNFGFQVRIPIVSGQQSATVALAKSELTLSEMEVKATRQRVELEVAQKYQRVRELEAAREVARLEVKVAQENVQVLQARFEEGRSNLRDIERARLEENDKWLDFLNSDYDLQKAQLELLNLTGNLDRLFR